MVWQGRRLHAHGLEAAEAKSEQQKDSRGEGISREQRNGRRVTRQGRRSLEGVGIRVAIRVGVSAYDLVHYQAYHIFTAIRRATKRA